ncbi:MAG: thioredoxin family protein [SAR202 cluster bacterium]|nr:thioredoxin family protein [SAR202 cluster bacterium]OUU76831.1 MAG: hypothetical protein CBC30_03070 [Chloroflexi bacterium TMED70]|tara:strand:- start:1541 stop:2134 length:594 start_codon:yes stop_codon:yes gene_type:complete
MKILFLSVFIFLLFACNNQETLQEQTSNSDEVLIIDENSKLVRTFENDYSLWKNQNNEDIYKDLSSNLGSFNSFKELREAQYRSRGIMTDLSEIELLIGSGKPTFLEGWSETCVYCKMSEVVLRDLKEEYKQDVNFIVIDVANRYLEDVTPTVKQYEIFSTPTYIIFDNKGDEIYRSVGYSAQKNKLSEILSNASKN